MPTCRCGQGVALTVVGGAVQNRADAKFTRRPVSSWLSAALRGLHPLCVAPTHIPWPTAASRGSRPHFVARRSEAPFLSSQHFRFSSSSRLRTSPFLHCKSLGAMPTPWRHFGMLLLQTVYLFALWYISRALCPTLQKCQGWANRCIFCGLRKASQ